MIGATGASSGSEDPLPRSHRRAARGQDRRAPGPEPVERGVRPACRPSPSCGRKGLIFGGLSIRRTGGGSTLFTRPRRRSVREDTEAARSEPARSRACRPKAIPHRARRYAAMGSQQSAPKPLFAGSGAFEVSVTQTIRRSGRNFARSDTHYSLSYSRSSRRRCCTSCRCRCGPGCNCRIRRRDRPHTPASGPCCAGPG